MKIRKNTAVAMHFTVTTDSGDTIDTSLGKEPLSYIQGLGMLVPGLGKQLEGKEIGFKESLKILAKEGYGERNEDAMHTLPKSGFRSEKNEATHLGHRS